MTGTRKRKRGGIIQTQQQKQHIQDREDQRVLQRAAEIRKKSIAPLQRVGEYLKRAQLTGGSVKSRKRGTHVKHGGKVRVINQQLISRVSHKTRPIKETDQIEGDAPLDAPSNPLPGNRRPNKRMGVLADELTSNLHLSR